MTPNDIFGNNQQNTGFVSFEEIENAFKTPTQRQADYEPKPDPNPPMGDLSHLADPDGSAAHDFEHLPEEKAPVDHDHAMRTGERIARIVDTGIDFTLSNFVARNGDTYRADDRDLQDIAECWGELAEEKGWSIGPEWSLVILYIMVYGPLVKQALTDRRMAELEDRQQLLEDRMTAFEHRDSENIKEKTPSNNANTNTNASPFDKKSTSSPYSLDPSAE